MLGAIAGDVIGSAWEGSGEKRYDFPLFSGYSRYTDDTVMTAAVAHALLEPCGYAEAMRLFGRRHPFAGYGESFERWLIDATMGPYNSFGNGGAMRASPIGYAAGSVEEALAVFLARSGASKADIRREVEGRIGYDLARTVESIRPGYAFSVEAERSVPEAIACFLDAGDFEGAVRNAVSLGGDTDTMACIAGAIAEAFWGEVPEAIACEVRARLPGEFIDLLGRFRLRHMK